MIGTKDNDYSYIEVFIGFLREIIEIMKDLLASFGLTVNTTAPSTTVPSTTEPEA